jgi:hypothetical protein
MSIPDFRGRTADQIVTTPFISDSAWHIHAALSWLDYVKRSSAAIALHYAAFHVRIGIEHLWFQIFWAGRGGAMATASVDSRVHPPTVVWDIDRLKRIHGECGSRLLHFQGVAGGNYMSEEWMIRQLAFFEEAAIWMWDTMRSRGNLVVYLPEGLSAHTQLVWESYRKGEIDEESVRYRLEIIRPPRKKPR